MWILPRRNRFVTCVDDPRASRTSFATSHLAVVYRGVPYDFLVMIDLHFFETKKSSARIRPVCPEGLCSRIGIPCTHVHVVLTKSPYEYGTCV